MLKNCLMPTSAMPTVPLTHGDSFQLQPTDPILCVSFGTRIAQDMSTFKDLIAALRSNTQLGLTAEQIWVDGENVLPRYDMYLELYRQKIAVCKGFVVVISKRFWENPLAVEELIKVSSVLKKHKTPVFCFNMVTQTESARLSRALNKVLDYELLRQLVQRTGGQYMDLGVDVENCNCALHPDTVKAKASKIVSSLLTLLNLQSGKGC
eukprot:Colp12_sorted_trinity150504_noHs@21401